MRLLAAMTLLLLVQLSAGALPAQEFNAPDGARRPLGPTQEQAPAEPEPGQEPAPEPEQREPGPVNLEQATEIARARYGGQVSRTDTVEIDGKRVHEIRLLLENGSVRTVRIDPATGAIIPQEPPERPRG